MTRFMFVLALLGPAIGAPVQAQAPRVYFNTLQECNIALESGAAKAYTPGDLSKKGRYRERGDTIVIALSADECFFGDTMGGKKFVVLAKGTKMWAVRHDDGTVTIFAMWICDNNVHGEKARPYGQPFIKAKPIEVPTEVPVLRPTQTAAGILGGVGIIGNGNSVVMNPPAAQSDSTNFYRQRAGEATREAQRLAEALAAKKAWFCRDNDLKFVGCVVVAVSAALAIDNQRDQARRMVRTVEKIVRETIHDTVVKHDTLTLERCWNGTLRQVGTCPTPPDIDTDSVRGRCTSTSDPPPANCNAGMGALAAPTIVRRIEPMMVRGVGFAAIPARTATGISWSFTIRKTVGVDEILRVLKMK